MLLLSFNINVIAITAVCARENIGLVQLQRKALSCLINQCVIWFRFYFSYKNWKWAQILSRQVKIVCNLTSVVEKQMADLEKEANKFGGDEWNVMVDAEGTTHWNPNC